MYDIIPDWLGNLRNVREMAPRVYTEDIFSKLYLLEKVTTTMVMMPMRIWRMYVFTLGEECVSRLYLWKPAEYSKFYFFIFLDSQSHLFSFSGYPSVPRFGAWLIGLLGRGNLVLEED